MIAERGPVPLLRRHGVAAVVLAAIVLLLTWRFRVSLVSNLANLHWLRASLAGPDLSALERSDAFLQTAQRWSQDPSSIGFQRGLLAWERGDQLEALSLWQAYPDDQRLALYVRGRERVGEGLRICGALGDTAFGFHTAYACLQVLARANQYQEVVALYAQVEQSWPDWETRLLPGEESVAFAHNQVGEAYFFCQVYDQALEHFKLAQALYADDLKGFFDGPIGISHMKLGELEQAEVYLRRATQDFFASLAWGDLAAEEGRWQTALLAYQRAAELKPDDLRPWTRLASVHERLGQNEQARRAQEIADDLAGR